MYRTELFLEKDLLFQKQWGYGLIDSQGMEMRDGGNRFLRDKEILHGGCVCYWYTWYKFL